MKMVVAGSRFAELGAEDLAKLDAIHAAEGVTELASGGAKGVDQAAEVWAESRGIPVRRFKPDWQRYGRGAGPVRNREMATYADLVVVFPGGSGTRNMLSEAKKAGKRVFDYMAGNA
jgi:predicted Rossmann fold nucleotide-binding protein DprA/Smf involved in DNA uptake